MKAILSIVNYNTKSLTINCLKSITTKKWNNNFEIWVVDNASIDGSREVIKKTFPQINLIENKTNVGFARAHNQVLSNAKGSYFFVVNSDCEIRERVLDDMIRFMEDSPLCGISSCKILGFDGKLQPNGGDLPVGAALINWLFNLEFLGLKSSFHINDPTYYINVHEVGWVSGNFMVIRDAVLESVGQFSGDYFMYFEDAELCLRAKKKGFKIMINPKVSIKHLSGGSLDDPKFRQWSGEFKGLLIFYKEHFGKFPAFFVRILVYLSSILRMISFLFLGKWRYSIIYAKVIFTL